MRASSTRDFCDFLGFSGTGLGFEGEVEASSSLSGVGGDRRPRPGNGLRNLFVGCVVGCFSEAFGSRVRVLGFDCRV